MRVSEFNFLAVRIQAGEHIHSTGRESRRVTIVRAQLQLQVQFARLFPFATPSTVDDPPTSASRAR